MAPFSGSQGSPGFRAHKATRAQKQGERCATICPASLLLYCHTATCSGLAQWSPSSSSSSRNCNWGEGARVARVATEPQVSGVSWNWAIAFLMAEALQSFWNLVAYGFCSEALNFAAVHHLQLLPLVVIVPHSRSHYYSHHSSSSRERVAKFRKVGPGDHRLAKGLWRQRAAGCMKAATPARNGILPRHALCRFLLGECLGQVGENQTPVVSRKPCLYLVATNTWLTQRYPTLFCPLRHGNEAPKIPQPCSRRASPPDRDLLFAGLPSVRSILEATFQAGPTLEQPTCICMPMYTYIYIYIYVYVYVIVYM